MNRTYPAVEVVYDSSGKPILQMKMSLRVARQIVDGHEISVISMCERIEKALTFVAKNDTSWAE